LQDPSYATIEQLAKPKPAPNAKETTPADNNERKMTKGVGTLIYQAPEIINGESNYAIDKTDVYSYGMLLYELFTQKEPYSEPPYDTYSKWRNFLSSRNFCVDLLV
jgi:serine/threonine protein kinase